MWYLGLYYSELRLLWILRKRGIKCWSIKLCKPYSSAHIIMCPRHMCLCWGKFNEYFTAVVLETLCRFPQLRKLLKIFMLFIEDESLPALNFKLCFLFATNRGSQGTSPWQADEEILRNISLSGGLLKEI